MLPNSFYEISIPLIPKSKTLQKEKIDQRADSRSKNYNPVACGTKNTFTER